MRSDDAHTAILIVATALLTGCAATSGPRTRALVLAGEPLQKPVSDLAAARTEIASIANALDLEHARWTDATKRLGDLIDRLADIASSTEALGQDYAALATAAAPREGEAGRADQEVRLALERLSGVPARLVEARGEAGRAAVHRIGLDRLRTEARTLLADDAALRVRVEDGTLDALRPTEPVSTLEATEAAVAAYGGIADTATSTLDELRRLVSGGAGEE